MSDWSKGLRGGSTTPRSRSLLANKRYSQQLEESDVTEGADTTPTHRKGTPKQGTTWGQTPPSLTRQLQRNATRTTPNSKAAAAAALDDGTASMPETASVCSDDVSMATEEDVREAPEGESVQVFVRVRPTNDTERDESGNYSCLQLLGSRKVLVDLKHRPEPYEFNFDWILPEGATQLDVFEVAGAPIVDNCMSGYNSSIFAYGQTGAGKTYTMLGQLPNNSKSSEEGESTVDKRGLAPRVFEYLFNQIDKQQDEKGHGSLKFCCRCSMLEIYNEVITDLLAPTATNLQIREDIKAGCYVEGLSEEIVQNVEDAMKLMARGAENRHVGETRLNRESSRSHSVFTCTVERHMRSENGLTNILFSRLNLIDLAGSERIRSGAHGGSGAVGEHFKEACHINKSLTTLGRVIMELVESQRSGRKGRHVPYRDSRLTFLLQDSLGGNAKTMIIANISPSSVCAQETLSTLYFVRRAKHIRNKATINIDTRGDVALLQKEIVRLNTELDNLRKGFTDPAVQENKELRATLQETQALKEELQLRIDALQHEAAQHKRESKRMDQKMVYIQSTACQLQQLLFTLMMRMEKYETLNASCATYARAVAEAENEASQCSQLQDVAEAHSEQLQELQAQLEQVKAALVDAQSASEELQEDAGAAKDQAASLAATNQRLLRELEQERSLAVTTAAASAASLAAAEQQLGEAANRATELAAELAAAQEREAGLQQQLTEAAGRLVQESADLVELQARLAAQQEEAAAAAAAWETERTEAQTAAQAAATCSQEQQQETERLQQALAAAESALADQKAAAETAATEAAAAAEASEQQAGDLREWLAAAQSAANASHAELQEQHAAAQDAWNTEVSQLRSQLEAAEAAAQQHAQQLAAQQEEAQAAAAKLQLQVTAAEDAAAETKEALEVARTVNLDLDRQLQALTEQLAGSSEDKGQLQQRLESSAAEVQQQGALLAEAQQRVQQAQEQLAAAEAAASEAAAQAVSEAAAAQEQQQQLAAERDALQQQLEQVEQQLAQLTAAHQQQQEAATASADHQQQQLMEQQQQLAVEREAHASCQQQLVEVQAALTEGREELSSKATRLEEVEAEVKALRGQMAEAASAAAARADQLEGDLMASETAHRSRQEALRQQITELANSSSALQQDKEALQDALDTTRADLALARDQLAATTSSSSGLASELAQLKAELREAGQKVSEAGEAHAAALGVVMARDKEVAELRRQLAAAEGAVAVATDEAAMQVRELQTELLEGQEALGARSFELAQAKAALEGAQHRLADRSRDLATAKEEVSKLRAALSRATAAATDKEAALGEARSQLGRLGGQLEAAQGEAAAMRRQLDNERCDHQDRLSDTERRFKQELLTQAKARRAFGEIRRIIDWAGLDKAAAAAMAGGGGGGPGSSSGYYSGDRCSSADSGAAEEGGGGPLGAFGGGGSGLYGGRAGSLSYSSPLHGQPSSGSYGGSSPRGHHQQGLGMLQEEEEGEPLHSASPRQHARSRPDLDVVPGPLPPTALKTAALAATAVHSGAGSPPSTSGLSTSAAQHLMRSPGAPPCTSHAIRDSMDQMALSTDGVLLSVSAEWGVRGAGGGGSHHRRDSSADVDQLHGGGVGGRHM